MLLEGSCHCGAVSFRVESSTPYPYQACYCSICRKTAGGGGYAINLGADANTRRSKAGGTSPSTTRSSTIVESLMRCRPARRSATSAGSAGASCGSTTRGGLISSTPSPRR